MCLTFLFQMVAVAKLEREEVEKKNEQLRSQVKDTESLLASHQDQLAELKSVMQGMNPVKDDTDARTTASTAPPSPAASRQPLQGMIKRSLETSDIPEQPGQNSSEEVVPGASTSFPHLIKPVCRTDIQVFDDFRELFNMPSSKPSSRAASGSYPGLNVMSLASFGGGAFGSASSSPTKSQPQSPSGSVSSPQPSTSHILLKETRFYKRALMEDIEPTLRLDLAPGISWLTRRTVLGGICEGSLLVEPMPSIMKNLHFACSMCGERRPEPEYERTHRFRTSDSETAQRYPLCTLCLSRVRSCCEFTGYLRLILDGHVKVGDVEEEKEAWEETVRLRERMFWSRIGGGVVPLYPQTGTPGDECPSTTIHDAQVDGFQPSTLESTGVQTEVDHDYGSYYNDDESDFDRASVYEDPFVSAGSTSPVSSVADSAIPSDQVEALDLGGMKEEVYEPNVEQVTVSNPSNNEEAVSFAPPVEEPPTREITTQSVAQSAEKDTTGTEDREQ